MRTDPWPQIPGSSQAKRKRQHVAPSHVFTTYSEARWSFPVQMAMCNFEDLANRAFHPAATNASMLFTTHKRPSQHARHLKQAAISSNLVITNRNSIEKCRRAFVFSSKIYLYNLCDSCTALYQYINPHKTRFPRSLPTRNHTSTPLNKQKPPSPRNPNPRMPSPSPRPANFPPHHLTSLTNPSTSRRKIT